MIGNEDLIDFDDEDLSSSLLEATMSETKDGRINSSGYPEFPLKPQILRVLAENQFNVHHECIPQAVLGADILCQTTSDMFKTVVVVLVTLQQLELDNDNKMCRVLVVCHSRYMAFQMAKEYERFCKYMPTIKIGLAVEKNEDEEETFKAGRPPPHIVIGTLSRILVLLRKKKLKLLHLKHFILDECEKMLVMRRAVLEIFRSSPHAKQVMMFCSTLSKDVRDMCKRLMRDHIEVYVNHEDKLTLHGLQQHYDHIEECKKSKRLLYLLDILEFNQVVIFVESIPHCVILVQQLLKQNFPAIGLHEEMEEKDQLHRYQKFKDFYKRILVTTIPLGHGIDIEGVNIVFNYDIPKDPMAYLHRVARAGRYGAKGLAITFISNENDAKLLREVQDQFNVRITKLPDVIDLSSYIEGR